MVRMDLTSPKSWGSLEWLKSGGILSMTYSGSIIVNVGTFIKTAKVHMLSSFFGTVAASSSIIKRVILKKKLI